MNYQEFQEYIKGEIKDYLPKEYQDARVTIDTVTKNNGLKLDGLSILLPD